MFIDWLMSARLAQRAARARNPALFVTHWTSPRRITPFF
jgi:hypothetical protein